MRLSSDPVSVFGNLIKRWRTWACVATARPVRPTHRWTPRDAGRLSAHSFGAACATAGGSQSRWMTADEQRDRRRLESTVNHMRALAVAVPEPRGWLITADGRRSALTSRRSIRERRVRHVVR
jgi:hypothetical protein